MYYIYRKCINVLLQYFTFHTLLVSILRFNRTAALEKNSRLVKHINDLLASGFPLFLYARDSA